MDRLPLYDEVRARYPRLNLPADPPGRHRWRPSPHPRDSDVDTVDLAVPDLPLPRRPYHPAPRTEE